MTNSICNSLFAAFFLVFLASCVPNRKVVYLQHNEELKRRSSYPTDSVIREHPLKIVEYRIQPLDNLFINFETLAEEDDSFDFLSKLSPQTQATGTSGLGINGVLVNSEGMIEYAILGKIKLGGLTIFEAENVLKEAASKYVPNVVVRVRLLNFRFTVLGEVLAEKTVVSYNMRLTMMEAIGQAGGLGELADRAHVKVLRQHGDKTEVFYVNLLEEKFVESPYYFVQQNDVIIVPPLRQRPFRRYFTNNLAVITSTASVILLIISLTR